MRVCEQCSVEFTLNPRLGENWATKTGRGKYCSKQCKNDSQKGKHLSPETEFKKGRFQSKNPTGRRPPNYINGIWTYRKYKADFCQDCSSENNLMVHHIDHDRTNNNVENLKTVCAKCHKSYHKHEAWNKGKKIQPLSEDHKAKISATLRSRYAQN